MPISLHLLKGMSLSTAASEAIFSCWRAGLASERVFAPVERELVFDIDLTDYDDVRTCGKEGHICTACWPLMAVAIEVPHACC